MELEKLIELAHKVAAPYKFCVWVLSVLLAISMGINVYVFVFSGPTITFGSDYNVESDIDQINNN